LSPERALAVICFFWSDPARRRNYSFTHDHVRVLKSMVARNLSVPHRFVCATDDAVAGVETVALDWTTHVPGTCGLKLMAWRPDAAEVFGAQRILLLDLDIVVTGSLDRLVERTEDIVMFRNPNYVDGGRRAFYQGSVQLIRCGARPHVWQLRQKPWAQALTNVRFGGHEQAWLSEMLPWDEAYWDKSDGIYGAGRLGDNGETIGTALPENARIVVFAGNREPSQPEMRAKHPWIEEHYR
jgi:hypothetical protein